MHNFRFPDPRLHCQLLVLLDKAKISYCLWGGDGGLAYDDDLTETIENDLIPQVRSSVFPEWQLLTCPPHDLERYRNYMKTNSIPFQEEVSDGETWFLIEKKHDPHGWEI